MGKKLAQSLLLMSVVAAMMIGGGMVQEGRMEMWVDPGISMATNENGATGSDNNVTQIADMISDEVLIKTNDCPQAHRDF